MQTRRLWILGGGLIAVVAAVVVGAVIVAGSGDGGDDDDQARGEDTGGGSALGICIEGATDCVDTVVNDGSGDAVDEAPAGLDQPVVNDRGGGDTPSDPSCDAVNDPELCKPAASNLAIEDLAARTGIAPEGITVVSIEYTVWDGCMGLAPTEGEFCTEIGIPGYKIILENAGTTYEYHTDSGARAVLAS